MYNQDLEDTLTDQTRKLIGYIMPILEAEKISNTSKVNIKAIIWNYKESLKEKLIQQNLEFYDEN